MFSELPAFTGGLCFFNGCPQKGQRCSVPRQNEKWLHATAVPDVLVCTKHLAMIQKWRVGRIIKSRRRKQRVKS